MKGLRLARAGICSCIVRVQTCGGKSRAESRLLDEPGKGVGKGEFEAKGKGVVQGFDADADLTIAELRMARAAMEVKGMGNDQVKGMGKDQAKGQAKGASKEEEKVDVKRDIWGHWRQKRFCTRTIQLQVPARASLSPFTNVRLHSWHFNIIVIIIFAFRF